jgi:hypothetical protein
MASVTMSWAETSADVWEIVIDPSKPHFFKVTRRGEGVWRLEVALHGRPEEADHTYRTREEACAAGLLLAMQSLPELRGPLHAALESLPVHWWKLVPLDDDPVCQARAFFSDRVFDTAEASERAGRKVGGGCYLHIYGPGYARKLGPLCR